MQTKTRLSHTVAPIDVIAHVQDCDDFDKKVEKLQSEKDRRMEECFNELATLEDGYRQKHRDAKQVSYVDEQQSGTAVKCPTLM